ncbi:hypothetical protein BCR42DRAFT_406942 [Absidia repens]|uniref:Uncharacterized protein n=1 Tax=Absidia repens TaxID=90262 RepID=A0A1X2IRM7_9FUNG|nr:hypothetical protein BCR42DRAFT_406942 [Absidia repens]
MVILPPLSAMMSKNMTAASTEKLPPIKSDCNEPTTRSTKPVVEMTGSLRHHYRAMSVPTTLPSNRPSSFSESQHEKSSMDVLLKAIVLDQKMGVIYRKERVRSFVREQQWLHKRQASTNFKHSTEALRRRSRSAPGAPLLHYYQHVALNSARWYLPNHSEQEPTGNSHDIAHALVRQHLKSASSLKK